MARRRARALPRWHRVRARVVGEVPRPRRARHPAARAPADHRRRADDFADEVERRRPRSGGDRLLVALFAGSLGSLVIGFVGPIGSLGPKPGGERGRGRSGPSAADWSRATATRSGSSPQASISSPRSSRRVRRVRRLAGRRCCASLPDLLTEATLVGGTGRRLGRLLEDLHARRLFGRPARRRLTANRTSLRQLVCPCHQSVVRPGRRRQAGRRARDSVAAATPDGGRRRGLPDRPCRLRPARRPARLERGMSDAETPMAGAERRRTQRLGRAGWSNGTSTPSPRGPAPVRG